MRTTLPIAAILLPAGFLAAAEIPPVVPQVSSVFPHGIERGREATVEFRGSYLDGPAQLQFLDSSLTATVESAAFRLVRARIRVAADAEPGRKDLRLVTPRGIWLGFFWVGDGLKEQTEAEPNDSRAQAQTLQLPVVVHGRADGADADYFRFHAEAGQTIVFDAMATRLGSALDPVITLFDARGKEIATNDDAYAFKDARLVHTFPESGDFYVLVCASFERSARDAEYRLTITAGPFALSAMPMGARRGSSAAVTIRGANLQATERVWLDRNGASCKILSRSAQSLQVQVEVPAAAHPGAHLLHLSGGGPPLRFEVSDLPETLAGRDAVTAPVIVNGEIPQAPQRLSRVQHITLNAKAGQRLEFQVDSWKLGVVMDPVICVLDPNGKLLAEQDDPAPNSFIHHPASHDPRMAAVIPADGRYRIEIHDAAYQAGGTYRLVIRPTEPAFELEVRSPQLAAIAGRTSRLLAVVRRTGGVTRVEAFRKSDSEIEHFRLVETDGWKAPVKLCVTGLPPGAEAAEQSAEPVNTFFKGNDGEELFVDGTLVEIPITVDAQTKAGLYPLTIRATGAFGGATLERPATVLYGAPRAMRHEPSADQKIWLNVIQAPPVLWTTPAEVNVSPGGGAIKVGLVRLQGDLPLAVSARENPPGFAVGTAKAGSGTEEVEVPVSLAGAAPAETREVVLVASFEVEGKSVRVVSPPIVLRGTQ